MGPDALPDAGVATDAEDEAGFDEIASSAGVVNNESLQPESTSATNKAKNSGNRETDRESVIADENQWRNRWARGASAPSMQRLSMARDGGCAPMLAAGRRAFTLSLYFNIP